MLISIEEHKSQSHFVFNKLLEAMYKKNIREAKITSE